MKSNKIVIKNGNIIDPSSGINEVGDVVIENSYIIDVLPLSNETYSSDYKIINAKNMLVTPGFIDLHTHLRDPGQEWKETINTGSKSAAKGGFTTITSMPNTIPALDNVNIVSDLIDRSKSEGIVRILPIGSITVGQKGINISPMNELAEVGVIGFSDDGNPVSDANIMKQALMYSKDLSLPIINHAEDKNIVGKGLMNEGVVSNRLGLFGADPSGETIMIARDLILAEKAGARLHIPHISLSASLILLEIYKNMDVNVTAEVTPHHLTLNENWVYGKKGEVPDYIDEDSYDTNAKVNPPLRTIDDAKDMVDGLAEGLIDIIATDHAPHSELEKKCSFAEAAHGINVLETAFSSVFDLYLSKSIDITRIIESLTSKPAEIFNLHKIGKLKKGYFADVVIINPKAKWKVNEDQFVSKSSNTPLLDLDMNGKIICTISEGKIIFKDNKFYV
ncbi:MAG: dihydroorotase [Dehalococcoidia bacterium]